VVIFTVKNKKLNITRQDVKKILKKLESEPLRDHVKMW
jgi:Mn-dependent DtxR family transcriptional regulator